MSLSLPPDKLADIQQLALSLLQNQHVTVHRVMSFWVRPIFVPMTTPNCSTCVMSFRVTCYMFTILPPFYFLRFIFFLSFLHQLEQLSHLQQSPVPLQFPLPDVVIATDATPTHWAFYFQGSGLLLSVSGPWSDSMCRAHIALQELQASAMIAASDGLLLIS